MAEEEVLIEAISEEVSVEEEETLCSRQGHLALQCYRFDRSWNERSQPN